MEARPAAGRVRLKILAISHLFPHQQERRYGIFVARQLAAMAAEGAEITLLVPRSRRPAGLRWLGRAAVHDHQAPLCCFKNVNSLSIPVVVLPGMWFKRWVGLSSYLALRTRARELPRRQRFDVIYGSELFVGGDAARRLAPRLGIPAACLAIGTDVNVVPHASRQLRRHFVRIIRQLDATLACGDALARTMDALTGRSSPSIYGVVDLDTFRPAPDKLALRRQLGLPTRGTLSLFVGYLSRQKGLFELLQAFEDVTAAYPDAQLVCCGDGGDAELIQQAAARSTAASATTFVGNVEPETVSQYMQAADLFVLPSYSEGMPNVVMEAMACGLPVVSTQVGGLPDALAGCAGAILVPPQDGIPLGDAMKHLVGDAELRQRMGNAARQEAAASFGAAGNARRILSHLRDLLPRS